MHADLQHRTVKCYDTEQNEHFPELSLKELTPRAHLEWSTQACIDAGVCHYLLEGYHLTSVAVGFLMLK